MSSLTGGLVVMRRGLAGGAVATAACLSLVGCTPAEPPRPTPTPSATTPSETAQEREERVAYEAAETSYRTFRGEYRRVLNAGGAGKATTTMRDTAGGPYLAEATEVIQAYKGVGSKSTGTTDIVWVRGDGYSATELVLRACEDTTSVRTFGSNGKVIGRGELRRGEITVRNVSGTWKLWTGTGEKVSSCAE